MKKIIHTKLKAILFCLLVLWTAIPTKAQDRWTAVTNPFDDYMIIMAYVTIDGLELESDQFEIGCFIDEECRGSRRLDGADYMGHSHLGFLSVWGSSDDNGKAIVFLLYDHQSGKEYEIDQIIFYEYEGVAGGDEKGPCHFSIATTSLYAIDILPSDNGKLKANREKAPEKATVLLTVTPDPEYELESISVYKTGDASTTLSVSGSENSRMFTMPAYDVTVVATFYPKTQATLDREAIADAKTLIRNTLFNMSQWEGNSEEEVIAWLVEQLNRLLAGTGISVSAEDIRISDFTPAEAGSLANSSGMNGSFNFSVNLTKRGQSGLTDMINGSIEATVYGETGLTNITADKLQVYVGGAEIRISGLVPGETVKIYNIQGQLVFEKTTNSSECFVPLSHHGVYIIINAGKHIKIHY